MSVCLAKGQKISLTKTAPNLKKIVVGLGWDVNKYDGQSAFDLDASAFLVNDEGKSTDDNFVYYGHKIAKGVEHTGDNLTGAGDGDDEQILVNLDEIPANIQKVAFTVTIYEADARKQSFGQVENAFIRIVDAETNEELVRYDLSEDYSIETAIVVAELYRNNGEWKFSAIGSGFQGGLGALCQNYGLSIG